MAQPTVPLPCVEVESEEPATHAVLWLHGLGADGNDFVPFVPLLGLASRSVRFVFPNAPKIPVTLNGGFVMPAWYDILGMELGSAQDEAGVLRSSAEIERLIERENERGIPTERIVLAGFSQGGAVATHVALRHPEPLAGLIALSTYLMRGEALSKELSESNRSIPIFQAHGTFDPMVVPQRGTDLRDRLRDWGYTVDWHTYPMQHEACLEEARDIGSWLTRVLDR